MTKATPDISKPKRTRLSPEKRIADILAAAREVLREQGYENALISQVAKKAGIVEGTIYRYFTDKRDLFVKLAEHWFEEIIDQNPTITKMDGTLNRLRHTIWWVLSIIHKEPALTRFVLMELRPHPDYRASRVYQLNKQFTENVISVFREAIEQGELSDAYDLTFIRDIVFGCIEHQTWYYLRNQTDFSVDKLADKIASFAYKGLSKDTPSSQNSLTQTIARLEAAVDRLEKC